MTNGTVQALSWVRWYCIKQGFDKDLRDIPIVRSEKSEICFRLLTGKLVERKKAHVSFLDILLSSDQLTRAIHSCTTMSLVQKRETVSKSLAKVFPIYDSAKTALLAYVIVIHFLKTYRHLRARGVGGTTRELYTWLSQVRIPLKSKVTPG